MATGETLDDGGGGGAEQDYDVSAGDYISGASIQWGKFASSVVGSAIMLVALTVTGWYQLVGNGINSGLESVGSFAAGLISLPFSEGAGVFDTGVEAFADFSVYLGPAAFPVAVVIASLSLWAVLWGVSRVVRW